MARPLVAEVREAVLRDALLRAGQAEQKALGRLRAAQARYLACRRRTAEARDALARALKVHRGAREPRKWLE